MGYNFSGLTFVPKGMIMQERLGFLLENAFLTHPTLFLYSNYRVCISIIKALNEDPSQFVYTVNNMG